jgi:transposase InsO family protein
VGVERVATGNGSAHEGHAFRDALAEAGVEHRRTRPYAPRADGEAERLVQTSPRERERACATPRQGSAERTRAVRARPRGHDRRGPPRSALGGRPPLTRLSADDLLGSDS